VAWFAGLTVHYDMGPDGIAGQAEEVRRFDMLSRNRTEAC